jgi:Fe-S-cluster containining protein
LDGPRLLRFRCTGCGNCCKDPLLPVTDADLRRIVLKTREEPRRIVAWADRHDLALSDDDYFVRLAAGKRVMVLKHRAGACRFLDKDERCGIYAERPLGCRIFPFDPRFDRRGKLRRLTLIAATDCRYTLDGNNDAGALRRLHERHEHATERYLERVAVWNRTQAARVRRQLRAQTAARFFDFLGVAAPPRKPGPGVPESPPGAILIDSRFGREKGQRKKDEG